MDRKKLILLVAALVIATVTALAARSMFAGTPAPQAEAAPPKPKGPKVLVAQRALPTGTIITADAIGFQQWPEELVRDAYFINGESNVKKLIGTVVRHPITAGEPVTQGSLVKPGDRGFLAAALGPGMRAVTVPVSAKSGVGGFVFPGDRVDLVLTQSVKSQGEGLKASETILRNLRVLATDQSTSHETVNGKTVVRAFRSVTLEVTPRIAEKIAVSQTLGSLSLSLRSIADNQSELERAIASGAVKVPEGASAEEEERILQQAMNLPNDGPTTYVTGGDVSRFQRGIGSKSNDGPSEAAPAPAKVAAGGGGGGGAAPARPRPPAKAKVRVTRGKATQVIAVGRNGEILDDQEDAMDDAAEVLPSAMSTLR